MGGSRRQVCSARDKEPRAKVRLSAEALRRWRNATTVAEGRTTHIARTLADKRDSRTGWSGDTGKALADVLTAHLRTAQG